MSVPWLGDEPRTWWLHAGAWVRQQTDVALGIGDAHLLVEVANERSWGVTAPVLAGDRRLWFKAVGPERAFEVPVTELLARRWPRIAPAVLAADVTNRWMLLADHGEPITGAMPLAEQVGAIASFLTEYGEMQRDTADLAERWVAAGVADRRVSVLAEQFEAVLPHLGLDVDALARCTAALPTLRRACAELRRLGPPDALEHADIHGWNVLAGDDGARLIDWGDCCVTHPFTSLCVPALFVVERLASADRRPAARRLRDAYLGAWGGPTTDILASFDLAQCVAPLVRVLALAGQSDTADEINWLLGVWLAGGAASWR